MIELVVTVCLGLQPSLCAEHILPLPAPQTAQQCATDAEGRVALWQGAHPTLHVAQWSCATPKAAPLAVTEIAPGIWVHKGRHEVPTPENASDLANIGFIVGDKSVAVIDAGGSRDVAEGLLLAIREVTDLPVRWLVLTHMHPDHVMGASLYADAGVTLVGHPNLPDALNRRAQTYQANYARLIGPKRMILSQVVAGDAIETNLTRLDLGGRELILTPRPTAHTDNDLTVFDPATGTIWMADLVFAEHVPALDGSIRGWIAVLDEMHTFQAERLVPGHGPVSLPWPGGMDATRDYLAALATEVSAAIKSGESLGQAITHVGADLRGTWLLFDEFNARNATAAYAEIEWE